MEGWAERGYRAARRCQLSESTSRDAPSLTDDLEEASNHVNASLDGQRASTRSRRSAPNVSSKLNSRAEAAIDPERQPCGRAYEGASGRRTRLNRFCSASPPPRSADADEASEPERGPAGTSSVTPSTADKCLFWALASCTLKIVFWGSARIGRAGHLASAKGDGATAMAPPPSDSASSDRRAESLTPDWIACESRRSHLRLFERDRRPDHCQKLCLRRAEPARSMGSTRGPDSPENRNPGTAWIHPWTALR
ncbi:hypothetical protein VTN02DRAFT_118 [Thermoascus thermophilus]